MTLHVGSVITNSGAGLSRSPDGKYVKLELFDSKGTTIPTRKGAAMKLFEEENAVDPSSEKEHINKQPRPLRMMPRWQKTIRIPSPTWSIRVGKTVRFSTTLAL
jgi:hypothetical protein